MGNFINAISGGNLYRKASFLLDQLDQKIFPEYIHIEECPHLSAAIGSAPFDKKECSLAKKRQRKQVF